MIKLSPPLDVDAHFLAANLRTADLAECEAGGSTPLKSLRAGMTQGHYCRTILVGIEPIGMCGCFNCEELETSFIWFLGTDRSVEADVARHWFTLAPEVIDKMRDGLRFTSCFSVATNIKHHEWLKALGYTADYGCKPGYVVFTKEHKDV